MTILEFASGSPIAACFILLIIGMTIEASLKAIFCKCDKEQDND